MNKTEIRRLDSVLTDEQTISMSKELSDHCIDKAKTENDKTESNKRFKGIIDRLDSLIEFKSRSVANGYITESISCEWIVNPDSRTKVLVRTDTGEQIEEKDLEDGEWQEVMPISVATPDCKDPEQEQHDREHDSEESPVWDTTELAFPAILDQEAADDWGSDIPVAK